MQSISPMTLGTVQLGMNYGIANFAGQPDQARSFSVLQTALSGGVHYLDTARGYGNSEEVIGSFLKQWKGPMPNIVTKIPPLQGTTPRELEKFAAEAMEQSLQALGVNKVAAVMLHNASDPAIHGEACAYAMKTLINSGYTDQVGVSVYTAKDIAAMLPYEVFSVTQVPMSIFDQRLIADGSLEQLKQRDYTVFVRSVFLQGLFFLDPETITDPILLQYAVPDKLRMLRQVAEEAGMTVAQLAIAFIRDCPGVSSLVLGAEMPEQVAQNLTYFNTAPLPQAVMQRLYREFRDVDIPGIMQVLSRPKQ